MCKQMDTTAMYPLKAHIIDCTVANSMETKPQPVYMYIYNVYVFTGNVYVALTIRPVDIFYDKIIDWRI